MKTIENILVLPSQNREEVAWIGIEGEGMHGRGETNNGPKGPDIGWMPLSAEEAKRMEAWGPCSATGQKNANKSRGKYAGSASFSDMSEKRVAWTPMLLLPCNAHWEDRYRSRRR